MSTIADPRCQCGVLMTSNGPFAWCPHCDTRSGCDVNTCPNCDRVRRSDGIGPKTAGKS